MCRSIFVRIENSTYSRPSFGRFKADSWCGPSACFTGAQSVSQVWELNLVGTVSGKASGVDGWEMNDSACCTPSLDLDYYVKRRSIFNIAPRRASRLSGESLVALVASRSTAMPRPFQSLPSFFELVYH